ncbi:MAG TPA: hypothetical protein VMV47_06770 [Bacteroidales bacterium]|nr:hypothetical protein [Bacteroidales bacterium]
MENRLKRYYKIFSGIIPMLLVTCLINAQDVTESMPADRAGSEQQLQERKKNAVMNADKDKDQAQQQVQDKKKEDEKNPQKDVKEIKSSKPDMKKARGARPPYISRPAGNARPQGAGKPSGSVRPGRR